MRSRMAGKRRKRGLPLLLAFCMGLAFLAGCWGARTPDPEKALEKTAAHVLETTPSSGYFIHRRGMGCYRSGGQWDSDGRLLL